MRLPHPIVLLGAAILVAAGLTWVVPSGQYDRRTDPATGRQVVVSGTYHAVPASPVGPFGAAIAVPKGFVAGADVIGLVLFVGAAWVLVERLGTLQVVFGGLTRAFAGRGLWLIPVVSLFFATMGALENMQEEIIPLVPALLVLGAGIGIDAVAVVAMSAGAAMVGSAFGPTNPFQAGIALKLAQLPPLSAGRLRLAMFVIGVAIWIVWTVVYAKGSRGAVLENLQTLENPVKPVKPVNPANLGRHLLILAIVLSPMAAYIYGALQLDWGFNELSGGFVIGALVAGLVGGLGLTGTVLTYIEGTQALLPSALMVGLARSISIVLDDGRITDTVLHALVTRIANWPSLAAVLMVPVHALVHVAVPSVSGHAVLTMPLMVPLADILGLSRQVPVLAYQTGAGLTELVTPTNGALMAVLLAAGVPLGRWLRFALGAILLLTLMGIVSLYLVQ